MYINHKESIITEFMLDSADLGNLDPEPLMFQSGYLTIKSIDYKMGSPVYRLAIPNHEVKEAFNFSGWLLK